MELLFSFEVLEFPAKRRKKGLTNPEFTHNLAASLAQFQSCGFSPTGFTLILLISDNLLLVIGTFAIFILVINRIMT